MMGFGIYSRAAKVDDGLVATARGIAVANISDSMSRMVAGGTALRPYHGSGVLSGAALTVRTRPGDNLMVQKAIDLAEPGDVIVIDAGGDLSNAILGELMIRHARQRRVAGFVVDGAVRDLSFIEAGDFPVYAAGITHRGPFKDGPGTINETIVAGRMVVTPGDLVVGDRDGVVCVPIGLAERVLEAAATKQAMEQEQVADIAAGRNDRSWIDARLRALAVLSN